MTKHVLLPHTAALPPLQPRACCVTPQRPQATSATTKPKPTNPLDATWSLCKSPLRPQTSRSPSDWNRSAACGLNRHDCVAKLVEWKLEPPSHASRRLEKLMRKPTSWKWKPID